MKRTLRCLPWPAVWTEMPFAKASLEYRNTGIQEEEEFRWCGGGRMEELCVEFEVVVIFRHADQDI